MSKKLNEVLKNNLYEIEDTDEDEENLEPEKKKVKKKKEDKKAGGKESNKKAEKDSEEDENKRKEKDLKDIDKEDMEDEDTPEKGETVVSINLNKKIKFFDLKELSNIFDVSSILNVYGIKDFANIPEKFGDQIDIFVKSPLNEFKDQHYTIKLMKAIGELQIFRPGLSKTFTAKSPLPPTDMGQAVQQGLEGEESEEEIPEEVFDITGYIEELNSYFSNSVKREYFERIQTKYAAG